MANYSYKYSSIVAELKFYGLYYPKHTIQPIPKMGLGYLHIIQDL